MSTINTQFQFTAEKPKITKAAAFVKSTKLFGGEKTVVDQLKEAKKSGKSIIVIDALHQSADAYKAAFDGEFKGVFKKVIFYSQGAGTLHALQNRLTPPPKKSQGYGNFALSALATLAIGAAAYYYTLPNSNITTKAPPALYENSMCLLQKFSDDLFSKSPVINESLYNTVESSKELAEIITGSQ